MRDERIEIIDVDLRSQKRGDYFTEARHFDFDSEQLAFGEWKSLFKKQIPRAIRIVHDEADDRAVGRVQNHQSQHMDVMSAEQRHEIVKAPKTIRSENGKL